MSVSKPSRTLLEQIKADAALVASWPEEERRLIEEELRRACQGTGETREPEAPYFYLE